MRDQTAERIDETGPLGPGGRTGHTRPKRPCAAEALVAAAARRAVGAAVRAGAVEYRRASILPRLVPVGPAEVADETPAGTRRILALLARALRAERRRGRAGHWSYDLNRHIGLRQAMLAEAARLSSGQGRRCGGRRKSVDDGAREPPRPAPGHPRAPPPVAPGSTIEAGAYPASRAISPAIAGYRPASAAGSPISASPGTAPGHAVVPRSA
jgi:hypothetical protein